MREKITIDAIWGLQKNRQDKPTVIKCPTCDMEFISLSPDRFTCDHCYNQNLKRFKLREKKNARLLERELAREKKGE